jgi:LysR family glycine cleavage system transcriptional activator
MAAIARAQKLNILTQSLNKTHKERRSAGMPVRPPSLRSIAAFEAAARHASFTKAAAELNLTPGAISHAVKALEERLDQSLFVRNGRTVALTPAGLTLAARVRVSLALLSDAFETAPWRALDRLVVSTTGSIAEKILLPRLAQLQASISGARLDIRTTDTLADFDEGIDVAIRFGPGGWRGLQSRKLAEERLVPVVGAEYRHGEWPIEQGDLAGHVLIHHAESGWRLWLDPAQLDPTRTAPALFLADQVLVIEAAAAGHGVGLVRERLADDDLRSGRLVRILDRAVPAEYGYWAVWNASSPKLSLIEAFVEVATAIFGIELYSTCR